MIERFAAELVCRDGADYDSSRAVFNGRE